MLRFFTLCIPFFYFRETRLNNTQTLIFHAWYEWLAGVLILILTAGMTLVESAYSYLLGYLPFIALYEIGYIINDFYASRYEENPRLRLKGAVGDWMVFVWILLRLIFAVWFIDQFDLLSKQWIAFAIILQVVFALHNFIREKELKVVTFVGLALLRFVIPLLPFLLPETLSLIFSVVLINYVLYRMINYLASKDLLLIKNRKEAWFKLSFYLLLIPVNIMLYMISDSFLPLILNGFYLAFWLAYFAASKLRTA